MRALNTFCMYHHVSLAIQYSIVAHIDFVTFAVDCFDVLVYLTLNENVASFSHSP